jgi:cytochrome c oxidase subunit 3
VSADERPHLAELEGVGAQYHSHDQQKRAAQLGMWLFIGTEILFFGGLFVAYLIYRWVYPHEFSAAAQGQLVWAGTVNTFILLTSSFLVALGDAFIRADKSGLCGAALGLAALLGIAFLAIKGYEYAHHVHEGVLPGEWYGSHKHHTAGGVMFWTLYWLMTGLHALHVGIGIALLAWMAFQCLSGVYGLRNHTAVELSGVYWHFVDVVWVFLYPLLYLL